MIRKGCPRTTRLSRSAAILALTSMLGLGGITGCGKIFWRPDLGGAVNLAGRQNRVVIVAFWSAFDEDCDLMERNVFSRKEVQDTLRPTINVRLSYALNRKLANAFGLSRAPSFLALDPSGAVLKRHEGYMDEGRFRGFVQAAVLSR